MQTYETPAPLPTVNVTDRRWVIMCQDELARAALNARADDWAFIDLAAAPSPRAKAYLAAKSFMRSDESGRQWRAYGVLAPLKLRMDKLAKSHVRGAKVRIITDEQWGAAGAPENIQFTAAQEAAAYTL
jgi:hypothetical protein